MVETATNGQSFALVGLLPRRGTTFECLLQRRTGGWKGECLAMIDLPTVQGSIGSGALGQEKLLFDFFVFAFMGDLCVCN